MPAYADPFFRKPRVQDHASLSKWHDGCTVAMICGEPKRLARYLEWWFMNDQIDERKIAAALFELITSNSSPDWFTEQELAIYLRLVNKEGKPVTAGIRRWVARDPENNPLPRRYVGDLPRFYRPDIIRWTEDETKRHKNKANVDADQEKRVVTPLYVQEDNVSALTAAAS